MNYIYDVIANFNSIPYDFFEWNKADDIAHLKKVLIIRVSRETICDLTYKKVRVSDDLLKYIKNKTEFYSKPDSNYIAIFSDTYSNICIKFNKDGVNKEKSFLQIEEDEETLELSQKLNETIFSYQVFGSDDKSIFKTRKEMEIDNYVLTNIKNLYHHDDILKLKYIYYDCFNKEETDKDKIFNKINDEVISNEKIAKKIYDFFKLLSVKID